MSGRADDEASMTGEAGPEVQAAPRAMRSWSVQAHLALLVAGLLVPVLVFAGLILLQFAATERLRYQASALEVARRISGAVDREVATVQNALQTLATSRNIDVYDLPAFHAQATQVRSLVNADVVLADPARQRLVDTRRPLGEPLPVDASDAARRVVEERRPVVSDLIAGPTSGTLLVTINVPVLRDGQMRYLLTATMEPIRIAEVLATQALPNDWTAAIVDGNGRIVARSRQHERFLGATATEDLRRNAVGREGSWTGTTAEGTPVLSAYVRSAATGWRAAVGVPVSAVEKPLQDSLQWLLGMGLAALLTSGVLAYSVGRRIALPMDRLRLAALRIDREPVGDVGGSGVTEIDEVQRALARASADLERRAEERDRAEAELKTLADSLDGQVRNRTRDLTEANARLMEEMAERRKVEDQLRQSQKMEAVGQLTGGIAHDFNNLLAIITGSLHLLKRRLDRGDHEAVSRYLEAAMEGAGRAATLTQRLLAFARRQPLAPEAVDPNRLIAGMSELLRRTLGEAIRVETVLGGGLWRTWSDPNQLENALLNLAVNARDAMPEGGRLTIETANFDLDRRYAADNPGVTPGQYVMIAVTDTGTGMPPEVAEKAFDPFFTTKPTGQGTGLGLSQVYGFIRQTGGHVKIYSEPGDGTTVRLYLPRHFGAAEVETPVEPRPVEGARGTETVLVVEDEAQVRRVSVDALRELGYRVHEAADAEAGLRQLEAHPEIGVLFTDVVMPGLNGRRLADEALKRRPDLKVLFTTGYTRNAVIHNGVLDPGLHLLIKPYSIDQLALKLREVLDS
ncbi:ATP-binding protein [Prosthecomicrobium sp. N25]|uniref:ATP-binding protein n=1 Tax=Prosthecomicrobium sp. N25 TaxID=3129254 RepID=UPI00307882A2